MLNVLHHLIMRMHATKTAKLALTGLLFCIPFTISHACSVHDHGCVYHGFNATVNTSYPTTNTGTSVVMYGIGTTPNTGTPSNVDFDTKAWIPDLTGAKDGATGNYTRPTGPYILNNTTYGTNNPPADTYALDDRYRLVYPSQYKITFNQNSAVARHTGDFNGAENGNIPNATGCPNMPGASNCEAVVITGNVPTGFYDQQIRIFNSSGNPNPTVDMQFGVYTTGNARIVNPSHIDSKEFADFQTLSGTGATSPLYRYEIVNTGYNPHAGGTAWFDQNRSYTTGYGKPYTAGSHIYQSKFVTTDTNRTKIYTYGAHEQSLVGRQNTTQRMYLGEVVPPPPAPTITFPAWAMTALADTKQALKKPETIRQMINTVGSPLGFLKQETARYVAQKISPAFNSNFINDKNKDTYQGSTVYEMSQLYLKHPIKHSDEEGRSKILDSELVKWNIGITDDIKDLLKLNKKTSNYLTFINLGLDGKEAYNIATDNMVFDKSLYFIIQKKVKPSDGAFYVGAKLIDLAKPFLERNLDKNTEQMENYFKNLEYYHARNEDDLKLLAEEKEQLEQGEKIERERRKQESEWRDAIKSELNEK